MCLYFGPRYCTAAFNLILVYELCQRLGSCLSRTISLQPCLLPDRHLPLHPTPACTSHKATTASSLDGNVGVGGGMDTFPLPWHPELELLMNQAEDQQ